MAHNLFQFENYMPAHTNTTHNNTFTSTAHTNTTQHNTHTPPLPCPHYTTHTLHSTYCTLHTAHCTLHTAHTHCAHTPPPHFRGHHISTTGLHTAHMELALFCSQQPSLSLSPPSVKPISHTTHTLSFISQAHLSHQSLSLSLSSHPTLSLSLSSKAFHFYKLIVVSPPTGGIFITSKQSYQPAGTLLSGGFC